MRRFLKLAAIIIGSLLLGIVLLISAAYGYMRWQFHLPSDAKAKAYFTAHKAALDTLAQTVSRDPHVEFVDAHWIAWGSAAQDPAHIECAKRLREIGAQFLRHSGGLVEIYFWGSGCAICHDSYKGFAFITNPSVDMPVASKICSSLANTALPAGKYAPIEDGSYLVPIADHWYLIRWECG
jgi:hypothetical protein